MKVVELLESTRLSSRLNVNLKLAEKMDDHDGSWQVEHRVIHPLPFRPIPCGGGSTKSDEYDQPSSSSLFPVLGLVVKS